MNMTEKTRKLTIVAMLCALAFVVVAAIRIPVVPALPFLKYEPKDIVILTGGFLFGPLAAVCISLIVSFLEMFTISSTGFIGLIMNILSTAAFACPAAYFYKRRHTMTGAFAGMVLGTVFMTLVMVLWNYLVTPIYMGYPREAVAKLLVPAFIPFNLLKGGINTALTLLLYKPLVSSLRKANLLASSDTVTVGKRSFKMGRSLIAGFLLITCVLIILVMQGKI